MSHRIDRFAGLALRMKFQESSGLDKRAYEREIAKPAAQDAIALKQRVERAKVEDREDSKYILPSGMNVEQHLFNLTFNNPDRPIKLINSYFASYNSDAGHWVPISDDRIKQEILAIAEKAKRPDTKKGPGQSLGIAANVDKTLAHAAIKLWTDLGATANRDLLAFRNGTVSIKTGKLSPHDPKNYLTYGLPYDYVEGAECPPVMREFIRTSYGEDQSEYIRAAIGLMLDLNAPDKFIHAVGPSGSGKGTFCDLIRLMFSEDSITTPTNFSAWTSPESAQQNLAGKRLFLIDDLQSLVTGNELGGFYSGVEQKPLQCRVLWAKQSRSVPMNLRALVASTGPIKTASSTATGLKRRVFPLPTLRSIQDPDRTLLTRLKEEMGAIISWALAQDKQLRNAIIEHPERYNELADDYFTDAACSSSSAWSFLENCVVTVEPKASDLEYDQSVDISKFYLAYKAYCIEVTKTPLSLDNFKKELKTAAPCHFIPRRKSGTIPARFVYLKLRPEIFSYSGTGATICDASKFGFNGINDIKTWAQNHGIKHPYTPELLQTVTPHAETALTPTHTIESVSADTVPPSVQPIPPVQPSDFDQKHACVCVEGESEAVFESDQHTHTQLLEVKTGVAPPVHPAQEPTGTMSESFQTIINRTKYSNPELLTISWGLSDKEQQFEKGLLSAETMEELTIVKKLFDEELRARVMQIWQNDGRYQLLVAKVERLKNGQSGE